MPGIYIMSSERSGSNLLRSMLGGHSTVSAPIALHILKTFSKHLSYYGELNEASVKALAEDVSKLIAVKDSTIKWEMDIPAEDLLHGLESYSLTAVARNAYQRFAEKEAKVHWVNKENNLFEFAYDIHSHFPEDKFVYLVRDGRDVASSDKKLPHRNRHIFLLAEQWKKEQQMCIQISQELSPKTVHILRYEDLISAPEVELKKLCSFLELPFEEGMLNYHQKEASKSSAGKSEMWSNISKPVLSSNMAKFKKVLSTREIRIFESVCQNELMALGYPLMHPAESLRAPSLSKEALYRIQNKISGIVNRRKAKSNEIMGERVLVLNTIRKARKSQSKTFKKPLEYPSN